MIRFATVSSVKPHRRRFAASLASALLMAGCTTLGDTSALSPVPAPVTVDTIGADSPERRLAQSQDPAILAAYGGAYANPALERTVAGIAGRLVAVSPDPTLTYTIRLLDSPQINAFALPGGYLYVTRGLLALANDASELAAVIAHEMAHVLARHGLQRQRREAEAELAARVVSDVLGDDSETRAALLRGKLRLAEFNRSQELEADQIGIELMARAGFDPYAAARFQKSLAAYTSWRSAVGDRDMSLDFLASHPNAPARVAAAIDRAKRIGPPGTGDRGRDAYLAGIDGLTFGDKSEEGFVRGRAFLHPGLGIAFTVPPGYRIENTAEAVLATGPGDKAVRFDGVTIPAGTTLAAYLQSGWVVGLDPATIREGRVSGLPFASASARANNWAFDISVIQVGNAVYRILVAAPGSEGSPTSDATAVRQSFRLLSEAERTALKPLRLRTVVVRPGDTTASLAARMEGVDEGLRLFRILNGLDAGATLSAGDRVKIVSSR